VAVGWALVRAAWPPGWRGRGDLLARGALAAGLGLGVTSLGFFLAALAGWPTLGGALAADAAALGFALGLGRRARLRPRPGPPGDLPASRPTGREVGWIDGLLAVGLVLVLFAAAVAFVLKAARFPHGDWDAWAIWNLRARFLYRGGAAWRDGFSPWLGWSHPDYPLLLPGAVARLWHWAGRESRSVPTLLGAVFTVGSVALLGGVVARLRGPRQALVASLLLAGAPILAVHGAAQYADAPLAFSVLAALALLALADRARAEGAGPGGLVALAGLAAGLAAWTKNEGTLLALAVVTAWLATRVVVAGRRALRDAGPLVGGLLAPALAGLAFRLLLAPPSEMVAPLDLGTLLGRASDPARLVLVVSAMARGLASFGGGVVAAPVLGAAYLVLAGIDLTPSSRPAVVATGLALALSLTGLALVFLVLTPYDLDWHLGTSLWRLLYQLWPATVLLLALVAAPLDAARRMAGG
jgi:hypothetical protein